MDLLSTIEELRSNPTGIRFAGLVRVCDHFFGEPRQQGTSHRVYRMTWPGEPRVNIQNTRGMAKAYQVRQVIKALERLRQESDS